MNTNEFDSFLSFLHSTSLHHTIYTTHRSQQLDSQNLKKTDSMENTQEYTHSVFSQSKLNALVEHRQKKIYSASHTTHDVAWHVTSS